MRLRSIGRGVYFSVVLLSGLYLVSCRSSNIRLGNDVMVLEFDTLMQSKILSSYSDKLPLMQSFQPSEYILIEKNPLKNFSLKYSEENNFEDDIGDGIAWILRGEHKTASVWIEKKIEIKLYKDFPQMAVFKVEYTNNGKADLDVNGWVNHAYLITAGDDSIPFWSFQSGSYEARPDWVLPLKAGFSQQNFMGMNASDYGGGTPVSDIWRKDVGLAVGHLESVPKLVSLPVIVENAGARLAVEYKMNKTLKPGESIETFNTFLTVHQGDYFYSLAEFSRFMQKQGWIITPPVETAYEPVWCAWGYERNFKTSQVIGTLPKVRELGFKWAVLDDGWQTAEGDWYINRSKFPRGERDMQAFVQKIHAQDLKAKLWWAPLAVDPGTDLHKKNANLLLVNAQGALQKISWWDSYYLCPAFEGTIEYTRNLVTKIMKDWDYDGLKIDGQHLNAVPPCYNVEHGHKRPEEAVEQLPAFFRMIYETAQSIKPQAVVEICPCGTASSFYNMPFMNQPVSSDPLSSWQIRLKGKTYKALMGPKTAYYGDHVELSDKGLDFASTVGIGGVIGTKFTWPTDQHPQKGYVLTQQKEKVWAKWMAIYNESMLPKGTYLGDLYDIGFDRPETHVIEKDGMYYYAFYAPQYQGSIRLRGLPPGTYSITDYVGGTVLADIKSTNPVLDVTFEKYLLIRATPINE